MGRYEIRCGGKRISEVHMDFSNLDDVAKKYGWDDVFAGRHPCQGTPKQEVPEPVREDLRQQFFLETAANGDAWLQSKEGGPPRLVLPAGVPGQRIYRNGRFFLQGPSPDFELHDCHAVFHEDDAYEQWNQAMVRAAKQNAKESWSSRVDKLMLPAQFEKKQPEPPKTLDSMPGFLKTKQQEAEAKKDDTARTREERWAAFQAGLEQEKKAAMQKMEAEMAERAAKKLAEEEELHFKLQEKQLQEKMKEAQAKHDAQLKAMQNAGARQDAEAQMQEDAKVSEEEAELEAKMQAAMQAQDAEMEEKMKEARAKQDAEMQEKIKAAEAIREKELQEKLSVAKAEKEREMEAILAKRQAALEAKLEEARAKHASELEEKAKEAKAKMEAEMKEKMRAVSVAKESAPKKMPDQALDKGKNDAATAVQQMFAGAKGPASQKDSKEPASASSPSSTTNLAE
ncbi:unnamed protein product [Symbiodinium sp. CCMP2456]|nr:unnamed protein product [Symbiodinium sp. CCMP2456]